MGPPAPACSNVSEDGGIEGDWYNHSLGLSAALNRAGGALAVSSGGRSGGGSCEGSEGEGGGEGGTREHCEG